LLIVIGGLVALAAIPSTRYWALNSVGVRSSSSIVIVDNATQLPLKGVHVTLSGQKKTPTVTARSLLPIYGSAQLN
jgi:hypothetical protein